MSCLVCDPCDTLATTNDQMGHLSTCPKCATADLCPTCDDAIARHVREGAGL